jgi:hypothetical protein
LKNAITRLGEASCCALLFAAARAAAPGGELAASEDAALAQALLASLNIPCTITAALKIATPAAVFVGKRGTLAAPALPSRYEVTCSEGLGYIVTAAPGRNSLPSADLCIERSEPASPVVCVLADNAATTQRRAVAALLVKAGNAGCDLDRFRFAGRSAANTFIEASCHGADGYLLVASNPFNPAKKLETVPCRSIGESDQHSCQLSDRRAVVDAMTASAETMFSRESGRVDCKVHARRYMMTDAGGNSYFEFMCLDGTNYLMARLANGKFGGTAGCSAAIVSDLGGCRLPKPSN